MTLPATIRLGSKGNAVTLWREVLKLPPGDGFDSDVDVATRLWQRTHLDGDGRPLKVDGEVGPRTWSSVPQVIVASPVETDPTLPALSQIPFVPAINYRSLAPNTKRVDVLVIHDGEVAETLTSAEALARYFASQPKIGTALPDGSIFKRGSSAHYSVDVDSIVQSVHESDIAFHAPGVNSISIGIEHAGRANQTREEWLDPYGVRMLRRSAGLAASICRRWNLPIVRLSPEELIAKRRGICGHVDVSRAFRLSNHYDPGPGFPWDSYLTLVGAA